MLCEVATASLGVNEIASATRKVFRHQSNVAVRMTEIATIDIAARRAVSGEG